MIKCIKRNFNIAFLCTALLFVPVATYAAEIYFGVESQEVGLNQTFEVGVFVNSHEEAINAVEAQIHFPAENLEFQGIYSGNSIVSFWVEQPAFFPPATVSLTGIIPGGFTGEKGYVFSLVFKTIKPGNITISSDKENILLHDGEGTPAKISQAPINLTVSEEVGLSGFVSPEDTVPPEDFMPEISKDPNVLEGKWFLVFLTQDKGSGISHYEVKEGFWGTFRIAESPYIIENQKLNEKIFVKAVDNSNNERIVAVPAKFPAPFYRSYWFIVLMIILVIGSFLVWRKIKGERK